MKTVRWIHFSDLHLNQGGVETRRLRKNLPAYLKGLDMKRFYADEGTITLMPQSTNPVHGPQIHDLQSTSIKVLGKVIEVKFTL